MVGDLLGKCKKLWFIVMFFVVVVDYLRNGQRYGSVDDSLYDYLM